MHLQDHVLTDCIRLMAHPKLHFIVIINPEDGPGSSSYPNDDYTPQIQQLNTYPNVRTIGYIRTGYATRDIDSVLQDVDIYSGWASYGPAKLAMHGIFFDEVPSEYTPSNDAYLRRANQAVKQATGLQSDKIIVHNPGTIPDARLNDSNVDFTVVFEGTYSGLQLQQGQLASLTQSRTQKSYVIHSVPQNINIQDLVRSLSQQAELLFVTSLEIGYYESFASSWKEFVNSMSTRCCSS